MQNLNLQYVYMYVFDICRLTFLQVWRISSRCHWEYNTFWLMSLLRTVKQWAQLKRCKCFCLFSVVCTVEPPCVTTFRKQPPTQNTKTFPVKASQLEPLENDHPLKATAITFWAWKFNYFLSFLTSCKWPLDILWSLCLLPSVSDHYVFAFGMAAYGRFDCTSCCLK